MDVKPRKSPRQARAKATVDAIVKATTQVLLEEGYDRFTTARAAERAGVSIGSLYQYFPNKAALASAVIDRCCENFLIAFESALAGRCPATLADCIRAIIDLAFVSHPMTPELHRVLLDLAPRIGVADKTEMVSRTTAKAIESMLRKHSDEIAPGIDLATAATMVETMLEALTHRAILAHPVHAQDDTLAKEATNMSTRYLAVSGSRLCRCAELH
jgi:AcrR family transcriptional regulator